MKTLLSKILAVLISTSFVISIIVYPYDYASASVSKAQWDGNKEFSQNETLGTLRNSSKAQSHIEGMKSAQNIVNDIKKSTAVLKEKGEKRANTASYKVKKNLESIKSNTKSASNDKHNISKAMFEKNELVAMAKKEHLGTLRGHTASLKISADEGESMTSGNDSHSVVSKSIQSEPKVMKGAAEESAKSLSDTALDFALPNESRPVASNDINETVKSESEISGDVGIDRKSVSNDHDLQQQQVEGDNLQRPDSPETYENVAAIKDTPEPAIDRGELPAASERAPAEHLREAQSANHPGDYDTENVNGYRYKLATNSDPFENITAIEDIEKNLSKYLNNSDYLPNVDKGDTKYSDIRDRDRSSEKEKDSAEDYYREKEKSKRLAKLDQKLSKDALEKEKFAKEFSSRMDEDEIENEIRKIKKVKQSKKIISKKQQIKKKQKYLAKKAKKKKSNIKKVEIERKVDEKGELKVWKTSSLHLKPKHSKSKTKKN